MLPSTQTPPKQNKINITLRGQIGNRDRELFSLSLSQGRKVLRLADAGKAHVFFSRSTDEFSETAADVC